MWRSMVKAASFPMAFIQTSRARISWLKKSTNRSPPKPRPNPFNKTMKIVRYETPTKQIEFGAIDASGKVFKLRGDIFEKPEITNEPASVAKLLAPLSPVTILGIGLNY